MAGRNGVNISSREVYDIVLRVEKKLDEVAIQFKDHRALSLQHESRLSAVEKDLARYAGAALVGGTMLSFVLSKVFR